MSASLVAYVNTIGIPTAVITASDVRTTGLLFMAFGIAYLIYRWFRDR